MVFLKAIKKVSILISLTYIFIGYKLLSLKAKANEVVFTFLAVSLCVIGLFIIIRYLLLKINERYKRNDFVLGAIILMIGVVLLFVKELVIAFDYLILGSLIIISALTIVQDAFDGKAIGMKPVTGYMVLMVVELGIGALVLINPFKEELSFIIMGISLIICGLGTFVSNFVLAAIKAKAEAKPKEEIFEPIDEIKEENKEEKEIQEEYKFIEDKEDNTEQ